MTTVVITYAPRAKFVPYHERTERFACLVAHRRAGKTTACIHDTQRRCTTCDRPNPRYAYIAPFLKQAKGIAWGTLKAAVAPLLRHGATINESELRVDYPNGGQIRLYGADNADALRGYYFDGVVFDEPAQIDPQLWPEVVRPALADRLGWATFIGTPKGRDAFYQVWRKAQEEGWFAVRLRASETGYLPESELAAARRDLSPQQYAREFECSFDEAAVNQFIDAADVEAARRRKGIAAGPKVLGVDPSRFGDDRTVVVFRNGDVVEDDDIKVWRGLDLMQTAGHVAEIINERKPQLTFVDGVGVGGGVVDRLRQLGFKVVDVSAGGKATHDARYANLRAEMWARMRDWIKDKGCIPPRDDLSDDLTSLTYEFDHRDRIQLEKKDDMKGRGLPSPDIADALALTFSRVLPAEPKLNIAWQNQATRQVAPLRNPLARW